MAEQDLYSTVAPVELAPAFVERLQASTSLAVALHTEKARSEFIIAPILSELKFALGNKVSVHSGIELDVDTSRGLNGYCDFILAHSQIQSILTAPVVAIVEAKNDNLRSGLGQCIAAMVAAREYNAMEKQSPSPVHGAVTTGTAWQFLRLDGSALTLDTREYYISEPGRILAILRRIVE